MSALLLFFVQSLPSCSSSLWVTSAIYAFMKNITSVSQHMFMNDSIAAERKKFHIVCSYVNLHS